MIHRVLVANRGEIAVRIIRACHAEGLEAVAAVSEADVVGLASKLADATVVIGPASPTRSYLNVGAVLGAALMSGCDAIHPGYGFLSERPALAEACERSGVTFVGPDAEAIRRGGDKVSARALATALGIPTGAGSDHVADADDAARVATEVGFPVLLKAAAGGGGRGMVLVERPEDMSREFTRASMEAKAAFGDGRIYVERFVTNGRHVEVQILADRHGNVIHLGDRDCSLQRRYQKVVEEAPAIAVPANVRAALAASAIRLAQAMSYVGAGTVEFLVDQDRESFGFLEMNTRLQVEHPVTEMVTGVDIVREQLRIASGLPLSVVQEDVNLRGHAIECRINAESPRRGFIPTPGVIERWELPNDPDVRIDTHCFPGYEVPPFYDSLLGKLIVTGPHRQAALSRLAEVLADVDITGVDTTVPFHRALASHPDVIADRINTRWLEDTFMTEWLANRQLTMVGGDA